MSTLTSARADVSRAVARLRSLGCTVHTVIGHDPLGGRYIYVVRAPEGIPTIEFAISGFAQSAPAFDGKAPVIATIRQNAFGGARAIVCCSPEDAHRRRRETAASTAQALNILVERIESYDTTGSASRQHFIETGLYLRKGEAL